jgi:hypothetical protein
MTGPVSPVYASNLEPPIERWQPDLRISGHSHHSIDFCIGGTRVLSNRRGYSGREQMNQKPPTPAIAV